MEFHGVFQLILLKVLLYLLNTFCYLFNTAANESQAFKKHTQYIHGSEIYNYTSHD